MFLRESDKHFLWSLVGGTGIILFWKGIWEGIGGLPGLSIPWVSLAFGLAILTFSGMIFQQFDPLGGIEAGALKMLAHVQHHPNKHEFHISYYDNLQKKMIKVSAKDFHHMEKNSLSVHVKGKEIFIPIHRVREVHHNGKVVWKL